MQLDPTFKHCDDCITKNLCAFDKGLCAIMSQPLLMLTKNEAIILSNHLKNEYLTHEEPARSVLLKVHHFADK